MGSSGSGEKTDWKDSDWKDGDRKDGDPKDHDREDGRREHTVEFLETEPSAFRLSQPTPEVSESLTSPVSRFLALGAVGIVLVALAIMSRPGGDDGFDQLPTADQQEILERQQARDGDEPQASDLDQGATPEPEGTDGEEGSVDGDADGETGSAVDEETGAVSAGVPVPRPRLPSLRSDLPEEVTGVLYTTGPDGSLVSIRWEDGAIEEAVFPVQDGSSQPLVTALQQIGSDLIMLAAGEGLLQLTPQDTVEREPADISELLPTDGGLAAVTPGPDGERGLFLLPAPGREPPESVRPWLIGSDLELVGRWDDRLLAEKAGRVWLLSDEDGNGFAVVDGQVLTYDGRYLTTLRCLSPAECQIQVGTPDQPGQQVVPLPETLERRNLSSWADSVTVSADGRLLGIADDTGAFSLPLVIDLSTGEASFGTDIVNGDSPLAWSPNGRFLAYTFGDDLVLWDQVEERTYRIDVDRQITKMLWSFDLSES